MNWRTVIDCFPIGRLSIGDLSESNLFVFRYPSLYLFIFLHYFLFLGCGHFHATIYLFMTTSCSSHEVGAFSSITKCTMLTIQKSLFPCHVHQGCFSVIVFLVTTNLSELAVTKLHPSLAKRTWHMQDSHGLIPALAFRLKSFKLLKLFPLRSGERASPRASEHGTYKTVTD